MLRPALHLFHLERSAPGSDEITDGRRVTSKKTELVHCQKDKTSPHHFRQHLGIQGYRKLDKEDTEERKTARPPCERRYHMAIQPFQIPWWRGMCERLIKDIKKALDRTTLSLNSSRR